MPRSSLFVVLVALGALSVACTGKSEGTGTSNGSGAATSAPGTTGSSAGSTTGSANGNSSSGSGSGGSTASGTSGGTSSGASSSGTTTGYIPVHYIDGGYVSCEAAVDVDGGDVDERWMCQPGTYFCGAPGACAQCRSDTDCADPNLPTYDPLRPHCDLDSGVALYWGFCEQCVRDGDCVGQPGGNQCDLNRSSTEPLIETLGFETCVATVTIGPGCPYGTLPGVGGCVPSTCQTDADCAGGIAVAALNFSGYPQEAEPYCNGGSCGPFPSSFPGVFCPDCFCQQDTTCSDGISVCNQENDHCGCTSSAQCGGPWPICQLSDAGFTDDAGELVGFCGCETDADCGDAGLRCVDLQYDDQANLYGGKTCLFLCTDPRFPGCTAISPSTPVCDATSGLCVSCQSDADCRIQASGPSFGPYCRLDGQCGCKVDKDCPTQTICGGPSDGSLRDGTLFLCMSPQLQLACTPDTCGNDSACNVDSGFCAVNGVGTPICYSSFDCFTGSFCDPVAGCTGCADNVDCISSGSAAGGASKCTSNQCVAGCASDADCIGNSAGSHCLTQTSTCVCASDADCAKSVNGHTCDLNPADSSFGACICTSAAECVGSGVGVGVCRPTVDGGPSVCTTCAADSDCQSGFFCTGGGSCKPRCDDGGAGCMAPFTLCDTSDVFGGNGTDGGTAVWCYRCLSAEDCAVGEACTVVGCSSTCADSSQCRRGQVCGSNATCQDSCDAGPCPAGQICASQLVGSTATPGLCYQCQGPADCPNGAGCNSVTHSCGSCTGPSSIGGPFECPPDAVCSSYWRLAHPDAVCLQNCDHVPCQDPTKTCAVFSDLTPFHSYCFGCLSNADCADAGPGAWCDLSINHTFACTTPGR